MLLLTKSRTVAGDRSVYLIGGRHGANHFGRRLPSLAPAGIANRCIRIQAGRGTADQRRAILQTEVQRCVRVGTITSWAAFHICGPCPPPTMRSTKRKELTRKIVLRRCACFRGSHFLHFRGLAKPL